MFTLESLSSSEYHERWTVVVSLLPSSQHSLPLIQTHTHHTHSYHTLMYTHIHNFNPQTSAGVSEYNLLSLMHTLTTGEKYTGHPSSGRARNAGVIEELLDEDEGVSGEQKVLPLINQG